MAEKLNHEEKAAISSEVLHRSYELSESKLAALIKEELGGVPCLHTRMSSLRNQKDAAGFIGLRSACFVNLC